jgi:hypothetical protein
MPKNVMAVREVDAVESLGTAASAGTPNKGPAAGQFRRPAFWQTAVRRFHGRFTGSEPPRHIAFALSSRHRAILAGTSHAAA